MTEKPDYYASFINNLLGLIDDSELEGLDPDGIGHLREALEVFQSDYRIREHEKREADERENVVRRDTGLS